MKEGIGAYGVPQHSAAYDQRDILSRSVSKRNRWERQRKKYIVVANLTVHSFYYCLVIHLPFLFFPIDRVCISLIILLSIHLAISCYELHCYYLREFSVSCVILLTFCTSWHSECVVVHTLIDIILHMYVTSYFMIYNGINHI